MTKVYQAIASKIVAMRNCLKNGNGEWHEKHHDAIDAIMVLFMPFGSGFNAGTKFDVCEHVDECASRERLVFTVSFHHMNDSGFYDGVTEHKVIVTPSFAGFDLRVTGRDRNGIKEYIADVFNNALNAEIY